MDERKYISPDLDDRYYGTGPTQPPRNRTGLLAFLLIVVIFLLGVITVLGVLNVRLFRQLQDRETLELSFATAPSEDPALPTETLPAADTAPKNAQSTITLQQVPESPANIPQEGGLSLQEIYAKSIHSVVSITASRSGGVSTGTGVVLTDGGYLVTNAHVVDGARAITVQLYDDRTFPAALVGRDEISDLAVLHIECTGLTPAQFGNSDNLRVGDSVIAIGDPLGVKFRGTCTDGIVSAINRGVDVGGHTMTLIQTNAALNTGNSGGPLINAYGQVIGINTMRIGSFAEDSGVEGLGFAIPSTTMQEIVSQLIAQGYVSGRPTLGITGESLSVFYQHYYRLPAGMYITEVDRSSDAYVKGIQSGDILTRIDDVSVTNMADLKTAVGDKSVGSVVKVVVYRGGQAYEVELELTEDKG